MPDDEIVVFAEPVVEDLGGVWIARLPDTTLSGGIWRTKAEALEGLYDEFRQWIHEARENDVLEYCLRDSGLTWGLASDFPGVKSRFRG